MADTSFAKAPEFNALDDIGMVLVADIDLGDRLRPVDPVYADMIGASIVQDGQATPIVVCRLPGTTRWTLVAGAHRVVGARMHGLEWLKAEMIGPQALERKKCEVVENLFRRNLEPVDRAAFIAELVQLKRAQVGLDTLATRDARALGGKKTPRKGDLETISRSPAKALKAEAAATLDTMSSVYGFTEEVAVELGLTGRTLRNDLMIYRGIDRSLIDRLRAARHPILKNATQLRALAKADPAAQARAVALLIDGGARTASAAIAVATGRSNGPADPEAKRLSAFIGAFYRMSLAEKKGALAHLAPLLPAGFRLVEDGQ